MICSPLHGTVTANFKQERPLKGRTEENAHIHGAVDIAAPIGRRIIAPEGGFLRVWLARRTPEGGYWPEAIYPFHIGGGQSRNAYFPFQNYFYDMYGGIIVLRNTTRTHVICHSYGDQLFDKGVFRETNIHWYEEKRKARFPMIAIYSSEIEVQAGETIGFVGDAGYSTGPHIHWEIHNGYRWQEHENRIDPLSI